MSITLVLLVLGGLLAVALFLGNQWKRARIRRTGTRVRAKVTQVQMWQVTPRADYSLQFMPFPSLGGGMWYKIRAEWIDPNTQDIYVFTSGKKRGTPEYQRGDYLDAFISPYGDYLKLS